MPRPKVHSSTPLAQARRRSHTVAVRARGVACEPAVILIVTIGLAVVLPTVVAALTGNLAIPHNDAWAYSLIAVRFAQSGSISLVGWNHPFSVGQEIALGPLGRSLVAQQVFVAILAVLALAATFALLRSWLSPRNSALGTAVVAAFPGFGLLSTSFMEDIPAYSAIILTLLVGRFAIRRGSLLGLAIAVAIGLWGFTTREQVLAAIAAVLISASLTWPDRARRSATLALIAITVAGVGALEAWRQSLPNGQSPSLSIHLFHGASTSVKAFFTLGLVLLPATAMGGRPSSWGAPARALAVFTGMLGAVDLATRGVLLGNYLDPHGAYSSVLLGTRAVLPPAVWDALQLAGWIGGILLIGTVVECARKLDLMLWLFGLFTVLGTVLSALANEPIFDRFVLPLVPVAVIVVLGPPAAGSVSRRRTIAAGGVLTALFAISLALTMNALAFDSARWSAAEGLVHRGVSARAIDAGFEWVGYHSPVPAGDNSADEQQTTLPGYARILFPSAPECYVLTASPVDNLGRIVRIFRYRNYVVLGRAKLLLYDTGRCPNHLPG